MTLLLGAGLDLRSFDEPLPTRDEEQIAKSRRIPAFLVMDWQKRHLQPATWGR